MYAFVDGESGCEDDGGEAVDVNGLGRTMCCAYR